MKRYSSPLREQQQEMTRTRIMEALVTLISAGKLHDFTVRDVAEQSGVSYGSVYRHYPTREALLHALHAWGEKIPAIPPMPSALEELPEWIIAMASGFEGAGEPLMVVSTALASLNLRPEASLRRNAHVQELIANAVPGIEESELRQATALLRNLTSAATWTGLRQRYGLDAEETKTALSWAAETLIHGLKGRAAKEETR